MNILFLNCFDPYHKSAGGAEKVTLEIAQRYVRDGHSVTWIASHQKGLIHSENIEGINIIRFGNRISVLAFALYHYLKNRKSIDIVIDQFHAYSFLTPLFVKRDKIKVFIHEVAGIIWNYQTIFPINIFGRIFEMLSIRFLYAGIKFITVSNSTRKDLESLGVPKANIKIIENGVDEIHIKTEKISKTAGQFISFAGIRSVKRIEDQIKAVSLLKEKYPQISLKITGDITSRYAKSLQEYVKKNDLAGNVRFTDFLPKKELQKLIAQSYAALGTSVKEGWGLFVNEAARLSTVSICYKVPGFVDSVKHMQNGLITIENNPQALAKAMERIIIDAKLRDQLSETALDWAKNKNWEKTYQSFANALNFFSEDNQNKQNFYPDYNVF